MSVSTKITFEMGMLNKMTIVLLQSQISDKIWLDAHQSRMINEFVEVISINSNETLDDDNVIFNRGKR